MVLYHFPIVQHHSYPGAQGLFADLAYLLQMFLALKTMVN